MGVMRWAARTAWAALQRDRIRGCGCPPLRRLTRGLAPQKMLIAVLAHPFRACQMALPGTARARRLARGIDVQDETGRLGPVRSVGLGIKEAQVGQEKSSGKYQHLQCLCTLMREHLVGHIQEDVVANRWICIARSSACWRGSIDLVAS